MLAGSPYLAAWLPVTLAGHSYDAIAVDGEELGAVNPFVLLADRADSATGDLAGGEELQDHAYCPPAPSA